MVTGDVLSDFNIIFLDCLIIEYVTNLWAMLMIEYATNSFVPVGHH